MSGETEKCGYSTKLGNGQTLVCAREKGHQGAHVDPNTYAQYAVAFGGGNLSVAAKPIPPQSAS